MKTVHLILLFVAIAFLLLVGGLGGRFFFPCDVVNVEATEDSIRARQPKYDSLDLRAAIRKQLLDSIDNLPTPEQRVPIILDYVRSLELERQLERAERTPTR